MNAACFNWTTKVLSENSLAILFLILMGILTNYNSKIWSLTRKRWNFARQVKISVLIQITLYNKRTKMKL
jgi:hypothetical protein